MTAYVLETFKIKSIQYDRDCIMKRTNKKEVYNVETDQIEFDLREGSQLFLQNMNNSLLRIYGGEIDFDEVVLISSEVEKKYLDLIIGGQINIYLDKVLQNSDEIKRWTRRNLPIPPYAKIIPNPRYSGGPGSDMITKEFISIESLPGHSHQMNYDEKLWFGSCWQMYFSPIYYKYIPKPLWDDFNYCFEHKVFDNGLRRITLFENPEDYDLPESRAKQWAFRRALGIDSIAHELTKQSNRIEPTDLPVHITKKDCEKGTTKVTRYLIGNNQLASPSSATKREIKEYLDDGITVVQEKTEYL